MPGGGVNSAQRPSNSVVKPAVRPGILRARHRVAGTKCTPAGTSGPTSRITDCLVEPTSVSIAPGARCGAIAAASVRERAHRGAQHHAIGAGDRARRIALDPIGEAQFADPVQRLLRPRGHHHLRRQITALAGDARDGTADQPDADQRQPLEQRSLRPGLQACGPDMNSVSASMTMLDLLGGADGDAQAVRQAVAADRASDDAARAQERVRGLGARLGGRSRQAQNCPRSATP